MLMNSQQNACFEHSYFFKVKDPARSRSKLRIRTGRMIGLFKHTLVRAGKNIPIRYPTTSFLTATTLIYAIGAGVTAAAGTRLALQWILDKGFELFSFQLPGTVSVRYCYLSSLPLEIPIG